MYNCSHTGLTWSIMDLAVLLDDPQELLFQAGSQEDLRRFGSRQYY